MNSTQSNCDIETLVGTRIRTSSRVTEEDAQIEQDVLEQSSYQEDTQEESSYDREERRNEMCALIEEKNEQLKKPDFSLAPLWLMTCIIAYLYGVTLGLYMCSK